MADYSIEAYVRGIKMSIRHYSRLMNEQSLKMNIWFRQLSRQRYVVLDHPHFVSEDLQQLLLKCEQQQQQMNDILNNLNSLVLLTCNSFISGLTEKNTFKNDRTFCGSN